MSNPNFWNCFEIDCISRDFNYKSYLEFHSRTKQTHKPVLSPTYDLLRVAFNNELEYDQDIRSKQ